MPDTTPTAAPNPAWVQRHEVLFVAAVSYRYHRQRQRFFDLLDKATKAATVLLGATLLGEPVRQHLPAVAAAISGLGLLSLVFGYSDRKQAHKDLADAFMQLRATVDLAGLRGFTEQQAAEWQSQLATLNRREPPTLHTLATLCQNAEAIALGHADHVHPVPWLHAKLANWCSFGPSMRGQSAQRNSA